MYKLIRSLLFFLSPEKAHYFTLGLLRFPLVKPILKALYGFKSDKTKVNVLGMEFPNVVGLAAGFDKDAGYYKDMAALGFGHIEIGTITPKAQPGNPKPRLFRLKQDEAIINRMGFNNMGVMEAVERLKTKPDNLIVGGNIGKNKVTPNEEAINDYEICFKELYPYVNYFTVNVSSPNTPNLRELQDKEPLLKLLSHLVGIRATFIAEGKARKPILLKIAPDLTDNQLDDIVEIVKDSKIDGVIATNTTISRDGLTTPKSEVEEIGMGGLSGKPLTERSTAVIKYLHTKSNGSFPIIGVGGIHSAKDAIDKLDAGASLVQLYSGFIYEGPALIKAINKAWAGRN